MPPLTHHRITMGLKVGRPWVGLLLLAPHGAKHLRKCNDLQGAGAGVFALHVRNFLLTSHGAQKGRRFRCCLCALSFSSFGRNLNCRNSIFKVSVRRNVFLKCKKLFVKRLLRYLRWVRQRGFGWLHELF